MADRCAFPGCSRATEIEINVYVRPFGLCERHWQRWARLGDSEKDDLARQWHRGPKKPIGARY